MATNFENYELETNSKSLVGGINELHSSATSLTERVKAVEDLVGSGETGETLVGRVKELESLVGSGFSGSDITKKVSEVEGELDALSTIVTAETTGLTDKVEALETANEEVKEVLGEASADDLSKLHSVTASADELNFMGGVTSNVQTQLDSKVSTTAYTAYTAATKTALDAKLTAVTVDSGLSVSNATKTAPKISLNLAEDGGLGFDENNALKVTLDTQVFDVQSKLPESPEGYLNKIVLVPSSSSGETNVYTEYIAVSSGDTYGWEILGEYDSHVDLSPYVKKTDLSGVSVTSTTGSFIASVSTDRNGKVSATTRQIVAADIPELEIGKVTGLQDALDGKATTATTDGLDSRLKSVESAVTADTGVVKTLEGRVDSAENDIDNLQTTVGNDGSGLVKDVTDLKSSASTLSSDVSALKAGKQKTLIAGDGITITSGESQDTISVTNYGSLQTKAIADSNNYFTAATVEEALDELHLAIVSGETVVVENWEVFSALTGDAAVTGSTTGSGQTTVYSAISAAITGHKDILLATDKGNVKVLFAYNSGSEIAMQCIVMNRLAYIYLAIDGSWSVSFLQFA